MLSRPALGFYPPPPFNAGLCMRAICRAKGGRTSTCKIANEFNRSAECRLYLVYQTIEQTFWCSTSCSALPALDSGIGMYVNRRSPQVATPCHQEVDQRVNRRRNVGN